jgi:hypothetical protein
MVLMIKTGGFMKRYCVLAVTIFLVSLAIRVEAAQSPFAPDAGDALGKLFSHQGPHPPLQMQHHHQPV